MTLKVDILDIFLRTGQFKLSTKVVFCRSRVSNLKFLESIQLCMTRNLPSWQFVHRVDVPVELNELAGIGTQDWTVGDQNSEFFCPGCSSATDVGTAHVEVLPGSSMVKCPGLVLVRLWLVK